MELKKNLKFLDIFAISSGAMISSGIFILPGIAFSKAGPSVVISYFLGGIIALIGILSIIELSTAMPKAGGDYFFINRSLGPLVGTISGFLSWLALSLKTSFAIYGISTIVSSMIPVNYKIIFTVFLSIFIVLNIIGVDIASKFEVVLVITLLIILSLYIGFGFSDIQIQNFEKFLPHGFNSILSTTSFIFVSFGGLINVASISEEVINPSVNIPKGIISSILVITILYTGIIFITVGVVDADTLANSTTPIMEASKITNGNFGFIVMSIAAMLAFITTANAGIMAASRYPLALSRDFLLPPFISKLNKSYNTPIISILITGLFIFLSMFLKLEVLVKSASTIILTTYVLTNISVIILRESKIQNYKPKYRVPLYPFIPIFGVILFVFFIIDLGLAAIEISLIFILISVVIYYLYGKRNHKIEYGLMHLIQKIVDKNISNRNLEDELKDIIINRDEIELDRFDRLVKNALIIDSNNSMNTNEMFQVISDKISIREGIKSEIIKEAFLKREKIEETALNSFVAIPHIVTENADILDLVILRNKKGVFFSKEKSNIKSAFILIGTKKEANFHLQCLAAIAQIVSEEGFEKKWLQAKNEEGIRDLILLFERERFKN